MSAKKKATISFKTDKATAKQTKAIFAAMGLNMQSGLNLYLKQVVAHQGIPFKPTTADGELAALDAADDAALTSQIADSQASNETEP